MHGGGQSRPSAVNSAVTSVAVVPLQHSPSVSEIKSRAHSAAVSDAIGIEDDRPTVSCVVSAVPAAVPVPSLLQFTAPSLLVASAVADEYGRCSGGSSARRGFRSEWNRKRDLALEPVASCGGLGTLSRAEAGSPIQGSHAAALRAASALCWLAATRPPLQSAEATVEGRRCEEQVR